MAAATIVAAPKNSQACINVKIKTLKIKKPDAFKHRAFFVFFSNSTAVFQLTIYVSNLYVPELYAYIQS